MMKTLIEVLAPIAMLAMIVGLGIMGGVFWALVGVWNAYWMSAVLTLTLEERYG